MTNKLLAADPGYNFDYAIVGGGSAGCVMASRLSANPRCSVILIESGSDSDANKADSPLRDASRLILEGYNWDYEADIIRGRADGSAGRSVKPFPYRLGKVLGGSSAVNGAVALIGLPSDFDKWAAMGCPAWAWSEVEPWFQAFDGCRNPTGTAAVDAGSPLQPVLPMPAQLHLLDHAFIDACLSIGLPLVDSINSGEGPAVGLAPANVRPPAERIDIFRSYLRPHLGRPNLSLLTHATAKRVTITDHRADGVEVDLPDRLIRINSRNVILCAGAIGTPLVLQQSGIGDASHLHALGVPVVEHLPAVGRNLSDHASVVIWATPKPDMPREARPWRQVVARTSSGVGENVDVQLGFLNNVVSDRVPAMRDRIQDTSLIGATVMLMRPKARGRVAWSGPGQRPLIELPLTADEEDVARLAGGIRQMWRVLQHPAVKQHVAAVRFWTDSIIANDDAMKSAVSNLANPGWHACGTARMGSPDDPRAAVGEDGRVHGISSLFVADASLFPTIPSMPTNLAVVMAAERIADFILHGGPR